MTSMLDVMTFLLKKYVASLPLPTLSDIFDQLIWYLDDNGKEIEEVRRKWLFSENKKEVEVALYISETFPFDSYDEIHDCYSSICKKWPELCPCCDEVINNWKQQFSIS